jgi:hypothetical protein
MFSGINVKHASMEVEQPQLQLPSVDGLSVTPWPLESLADLEGQHITMLTPEDVPGVLSTCASN